MKVHSVQMFDEAARALCGEVQGGRLDAKSTQGPGCDRKLVTKAAYGNRPYGDKTKREKVRAEISDTPGAMIPVGH